MYCEIGIDATGAVHHRSIIDVNKHTAVVNQEEWSSLWFWPKPEHY